VSRKVSLGTRTKLKQTRKERGKRKKGDRAGEKQSMDCDDLSAQGYKAERAFEACIK